MGDCEARAAGMRRFPHDSASECLAAGCGTCAPNGDVGVVEGAAGERVEAIYHALTLLAPHGGDSGRPYEYQAAARARESLVALVADCEALLERAEKAESEAELWQRRTQHAYKLLDEGGHGSAVSRGSGGETDVV